MTCIQYITFRLIFKISLHDSIYSGVIDGNLSIHFKQKSLCLHLSHWKYQSVELNSFPCFEHPSQTIPIFLYALRGSLRFWKLPKHSGHLRVKYCLERSSFFRPLICLTNIPRFGGHVKYRTPRTWPSCWPKWSCNSTPIQTPRWIKIKIKIKTKIKIKLLLQTFSKMYRSNESYCTSFTWS